MSVPIALKDWSPTSFDPQVFDTGEHADWLVVPSTHRMCGCSDAMWFRFNRVVRTLVQRNIKYCVLRFRHWACGWFEIIVLEPSQAARKYIHGRREAPEEE